MDLSTVDLTALVERDGVTLRPVAGEFHGPCPACGGRDRFCVWTHGDRQMYRCRKCHPKPADAVAYLRWRYGLGFVEACAALQVQPDRPAQPVVSAPRPYEPVNERPEIWRTAVAEFVDACATALWQPEAAAVRRYLAERGLTTDTLRRHRIGYHAPAGGARGAKIAGRWWA